MQTQLRTDLGSKSFSRREEIAALDKRATDVETAIVGGAIRIHFAKA